MKTKMCIRLVEYGGPHFYTTNDGEKAFEKITAAFKDDNNVEVSFDGIEDVTTAVLHEVVGSLYKIFDEDFIREHIKYVNTTSEQDRKIDIVAETAKDVFRNPEKHKAIVDDVLGRRDD